MRYKVLQHEINYNLARPTRSHLSQISPLFATTHALIYRAHPRYQNHHTPAPLQHHTTHDLGINVGVRCIKGYGWIHMDGAKGWRQG